jgi:type IV secretion system protein VirB10
MSETSIPAEVTDYTPVETGALPSLHGNDKGEVLGVPESRAKSKTNVRKLAILVMSIVAFCFIVGGLLVWQKNKKARTAAADKPAAAKADFAVKNTSLESDNIEKAKAELKKKDAEEAARLKAIQDAQDAAQKAAEAEAARKAATAAQPAAGATPQPARNAGAGGPSGQPGAQPPRPMTPEERKLAGSVLLDNTGARPATGSAQLTEKDAQQREVAARMAALGYKPDGTPLSAPAAVAAGSTAATGFSPASPSPAAGPGGGESLAGRLQPTVLQARFAGRLPNLDYLLVKGTSIPCALQTAIDTTLPGFVICKVLSDVYSANSKTLLVERGATVFGEQQSSLKQGQQRTFVVWSRIDNPSGVFANIDSPATDPMGASGIPGFVDTHFWTRFGGAIMMSFIKDFSAATSQRVAGTSSGATGQQPLQNTQQATQDMATEALRNSINIPPTLVVLPGTIVNVLVARDVSFENVYRLAE